LCGKAWEERDIKCSWNISRLPRVAARLTAKTRLSGSFLSRTRQSMPSSHIRPQRHGLVTASNTGLNKLSFCVHSNSSVLCFVEITQCYCKCKGKFLLQTFYVLMFCVLYIIQQQPYYDLCHTAPFIRHLGIQLWRQCSEVPKYWRTYPSRTSLLQISLPLE
jgi:hypothetical protein